MKPLKLEQSDTTNSNKTENETTKTENESTKTRTIRYNEQQQNRE
jgi:Spy/CpxP family protein refolding chaperone